MIQGESSSTLSLTEDSCPPVGGSQVKFLVLSPGDKNVCTHLCVRIHFINGQGSANVLQLALSPGEYLHSTVRSPSLFVTALHPHRTAFPHGHGLFLVRPVGTAAVSILMQTLTSHCKDMHSGAIAKS